MDVAGEKTLSAEEVRSWLLVVAAAVVASESWGVPGAIAAALLAVLVGLGSGSARQAPWLAATAAVCTAGAGAIHLAVAEPHVREWWAFGAFFITSGLVQLAWGARLTVQPGRPLLYVGLVGNLAVVAVWAVSRTWGLPLGPEPGEAEAIGPPDLVATALEVVAAAACWAALARATKPQTRVRLPLAAAAVAVVAYGVATASGHS